MNKSVIICAAENSRMRPARHLPCFGPPGWCNCCPDSETVLNTLTKAPLVHKESTSQPARVAQWHMQEWGVCDKENFVSEATVAMSSEENQVKKSLSIGANALKNLLVPTLRWIISSIWLIMPGGY